MRAGLPYVEDSAKMNFRGHDLSKLTFCAYSTQGPYFRRSNLTICAYSPQDPYFCRSKLTFLRLQSPRLVLLPL